jgi:Kef-type K+ transport system membrane component KefB
VILAACRLAGWLSARLGQPQVVGEMIAGIVLGPSVFGAVAPDAASRLFPTTLGAERHPSMAILYAASQVGIVAYMFLVGLKFDFGRLGTHKRAASAVAASGIVFPLAVGAAIGIVAADGLSLFEPGVPRWAAALYLGAALCITAFPMLARILVDRGLLATPIGTLTLGAGAVSDAAAWMLLCVVIGGVEGSVSAVATAVLGGVLVAGAMALGARRLLVYLSRNGAVGIAASIALLVAGAWFTDRIGIHAVFGAFLAGACVPKALFPDRFVDSAARVSSLALLPLFFAYTGIQTNLDLLGSASLGAAAAVICVAAIVSKGVGCMLGARLAGETWKDAAGIGSLMNGRGLMGSVMASIGLEKGIASEGLYAILILMTLITTLMATPLFDLFQRTAARPVSRE